MEYLSRKALATCTVPVTRKRSFVNGKPNTFSAASSIPDPIVLLNSLEHHREFSSTPAVQRISRKKSIKVLRNLYDIDKNIKCLKTSKVSISKKRSGQNKNRAIKTENLPAKIENTSAENIEQHPQDAAVKTGLEDKSDSSCHVTTAVENCSSVIHDGKPCKENESLDSTEKAILCKTDDTVTNSIDETPNDDNIVYCDDDIKDPDYIIEEKNSILKSKRKVSKTFTPQTNKIKTRSSSVKKIPEVKILPVKKGRGRPKKTAPKKLENSTKFTTTKVHSPHKSAGVSLVKKEECVELEDTENNRGRSKAGCSKVNKEYKCKSCPYVTPRKFHLIEHEKRRHMTKTFKCEICNKIFGFGKDLNRHRNTHLKPENCCDICGKLYKGVKTLAQHKLTHDSKYVKPEFSCEVCNKTFSTKYVLAYHIKSEHLGMKRRFICPTCGKSFSQKNSYIQHANVHMGYKPFRCEVCGKCFSYDKSLKEHKFMHDEKKHFNCPICNKAFRQSSAITIHLKVHKETKDYVCSACGKGFSQKQALVRHERIHLGEKPFSCQLCQRTFTDSSVLRRHMILIHKKDPKKWREDTKQNTARRADFFISVIGDITRADAGEALSEPADVSNGNQMDEEETVNLAEDTEDVKGTINISSVSVASQGPPMGLGVDGSHEAATLQQASPQQPSQLGMPVEVAIVNSGQQQFHSTRPFADIIPKSEIQIQHAIMLPEEQILASPQIEHVDSKAYLHVLDQRGEGFINQTHPSILPYNLMGTADYSNAMVMVSEVSSAAFASACSKATYSQPQYVDPSISTANHGNPYTNYQPPDG
ncbi:zinc finger protein 729-like [Gigantopelta aegis]|uniref:zinc finger protein 729-like n=1 Tax=Gigantopelta aegis TaxID=1735272 RepID=UPI001B88C084|nr:zinc finger protein 729-like [Gigantopelta aegis]